MDAKTLFYTENRSITTTSIVESFLYTKKYVEPYSDMEFDEDNVNKDRIINKCKGFLYAYLIGANTSPGKVASNLQRILKELSNLIHARIVNNDLDLHTSKLIELQRQFIDVAHKYDITKDLEISAKHLNNSTVEMLKKELIYLGVWDVITNRMFSLPDLSSGISIEQWNVIENKMLDFIKKIISEQNKHLSVEEIPSLNKFIPVVVNEADIEEKIFTEWVSILLKPECNLKTFFTNKLPFLKELGTVARNLMGEDSFAKSCERIYYNGLIKNIREAEDFDLTSLKSPVWQSLALCAKITNSDIDALYSLMKSYGVEDYRYAVSLWGAICGYADMPKTFYNKITDNISIEEAYGYVINISKNLYGFEGGNIMVRNNLTFIESHITESLQTTVCRYMEEYEKSGKKLSIKSKDSIHKALNTVTEGTVLNFLTKLKGLTGFIKIGSNSFWTYLKDRACPEYDQIITNGKINKKTKKNDMTLSLFDQNKELEGTNENNNFMSKSSIKHEPNEPTDSLFIYDKNVKYYIMECAYFSVEIRNVLSKEVLKFQNYYKEGKYYNQPDRYPIDNRSTIKHFKNWCFYDNGSYRPIIKDSNENRQRFDLLAQDLLSRYGK